MSGSPDRSFEAITFDDLNRLAKLAIGDFNALMSSRAKSATLYAGRLRMLCLCQGAARHFVNGDRGVQDFDIWGFFEVHPAMAFPCRRRGVVDFGPSRFGRNPDDVGFTGRRVDIMGRSLEIDKHPSRVDAIRDYLEQGRTRTARLLSAQPVVVLAGFEAGCGDVIWDGKPDRCLTGLRDGMATAA